ncbi:MAG: hypothetical protein WBA74_16280, partial [Cyclobacteriaceae bacterium]
MNSFISKKNDIKDNPATKAVSKVNSISKGTFQLVDNRPQADAQRKMQEMANKSLRVVAQKKLQHMASNAQPATLQLQGDEDIGSLNTGSLLLGIISKLSALYEEAKGLGNTDSAAEILLRSK